VRDCLHPRDLAPLLLAQLASSGEGKPRIVNLAGGIANSLSLRELSAWCSEHIAHAAPLNDPNAISSEHSTRAFDIPWSILDPARAKEAWGWAPSTSLPDILQEIRTHAEKNPHWLAMVTG